MNDRPPPFRWWRMAATAQDESAGASKTYAQQAGTIRKNRACKCSQIHVFHVVDGLDLVHKFKGFHNTNRQISASVTSNGKYVVCASEDSQVYVWKHEGESRASRNKSITVTHSYEYFHCQDVSVAIPWPGEPNRLSGDHFDDVSAANHPPTPEDQFNSGPFDGIISSASNGYFFDRFSATWPEEKLVSTTKNQSKHKSVDFSNGSTSKSGWGMVIVTAGLRGEIRTAGR